MKLSDIHGQEHITAVLRAAVLREKPLTKINFYGDGEITDQIVRAYVSALNCQRPQRGDACGDCAECAQESELAWTTRLLVPPRYWIAALAQWEPDREVERVVYYSYNCDLEGFTNFEIKSPVGARIDKDILALLLYSYEGAKPEAVGLSREIAKAYSLGGFIEAYLEIFKNILYLKSNLEITESSKLDVLRQLAIRMPIPIIASCMQLLWEAESRTAVADALSIEVVSLLLSEKLRPSRMPEYIEITFEDGSEPITQVDGIPEQPLDLEKMLEIARE